MSPSPTKNGSASIPCTWTGTPSGHEPNSATGRQDSNSNAPIPPGRVWANFWAGMTPSENPAYTNSAGSPSAARTPRSSTFSKPISPA